MTEPKRPDAEAPQRPPPPPQESLPHDRDEQDEITERDDVEEAGEESFPASDAPSYSARREPPKQPSKP